MKIFSSFGVVTLSANVFFFYVILLINNTLFCYNFLKYDQISMYMHNKTSRRHFRSFPFYYQKFFHCLKPDSLFLLLKRNQSPSGLAPTYANDRL